MTASAAFQALTAQSVQQALSTKAFGRTLHLLEGTSSTNTVAMTLGQEGASHGTVVVAETQTAGRGRSGRQWYSPPGKNLYCSVVLRSMPSPDQLALWLSWIPLIAGLAAVRAVQTTAALHPSVKWPNDILSEHGSSGALCAKVRASARLIRSSWSASASTSICFGTSFRTTYASSPRPWRSKRIGPSIAPPYWPRCSWNLKAGATHFSRADTETC